MLHPRLEPRFPSSRKFVINACAPGRHVLQLGLGCSDVTAELKRKLCHVTAVDLARNRAGGRSTTSVSIPRRALRLLPRNVGWFDRILLIELIEHLRDPGRFMEELRRRMARRGSEVIITASNVRSLVTRIMNRLGRSNHSKNVSESELRWPFTFQSLSALLEEVGYEIVEAEGVPAPFPTAMGDTRWSRLLLKLNQLSLKISKQLFAYQICVRARPAAKTCAFPKQTISESVPLPPQLLGRVA